MANPERNHDDPSQGAERTGAPRRVTEATRRAEGAEADASHVADRAPTPEEEQDAPADVDPEVAERYEEMARLGANAEGEGRLP